MSKFSVANANYSLKYQNNKALLTSANAITIAAGITNGTVAVNKTQAASDETITLTPTPAAGYKLSAWNVYKTGETSTTIVVTNNTFTMPAYAVTVSATFVEKDAVSIGETEYRTLEAAVTAAAADATIIINKDVTVTSAISFDKSLTIKPAVANVKILRGTELGNNALFTMGGANVTVTIGDADKALIIDGQSTEFAGQLISIPEDKGTLNLVNATVQNVHSTDSKGVIFAKKKSGGTGIINLNGVTFSNCKATAENAGIIFCGATESVVLQGANTFSSCVGNNFYLEGRILVDNTITPPSTPYTIYALLSKFTNNSGIVNGAVVKYSNTSYYGENHFAIVNSGYEYELNNTTTPPELKLKATPYNVSAGTITGGSLHFSMDGETYSTSLTDATVGATIYIKVAPTEGNFLSGLPTATYGTTPTALEVTATTTDGVYTFTMPAAAVTAGATFITPAAGNVWNQTQNTGHATLADAVTNAAANDIIIIRANTEENDAITFEKNLTIKPAAAGISIKRATSMTGENDKVLFSLATADVTVTIGDASNTLTIDGQSTVSTKALAQVTAGTLNMVNVAVKNAVTSNTQGVFCAKNNGTITLRDVSFNGCQATADKAGIVFCGRNDAIKLEGAISFTGGNGYNFLLEKRLRVMNTLTAAGMTLFAKETEGGVVTTLANSLAVVYENNSFYSADHFALQNAGYTMALQENGKDVALVAKSFKVAIASSIENGTINTDAADANNVTVGTEVTITATPAENYALKAGSLAVTYGSENIPVTITDGKFTMPAGDVTITAEFETTLTTPMTIVVKDRVNKNGATRKYADDSKTVASTNANNSVWYLGEVDMSKVYSIEVKGAAFVSGTVNNVENTKAQLKLGYLPVGTITSVSSDGLDTNSGTIRAASNLMAQLTAETTPTTVAEGNDATNYPGADFLITAAGVSQTGTYEGTVTIDTENTKGLQKTDAVYQLFLYGTASSRRLSVDEVIINFRGESIPDGAYTDNTYVEPMTNEGQDTEVIGEPEAGYIKAVLGASADTYVRKGNNDNNGAKPQMEVYTYTDTEASPAVDKDFVGLLAFDLPARAKSAGAEIQKVQLRLVGKRLKGDRGMKIYNLGTDFEENAKYADLETAISAAREAGAIHSYETRGQVGYDNQVDDMGGWASYNMTIAGWTNYFDLTEFVKNLSDTKVRLMITSPDNADNPKMYYTKEAEGFTNGELTALDADLIPQLIIVYKEGENILNVTHPAMLHTQDDIDRVKRNLGMSPIRDAYAHLLESDYAQTSYTASPVEYLKRMDETNWGPNGTYGQNADYNNYTNAMKDANAAYQLALRYQLEGSTASADAAVGILNAWATTNKGLYKIAGEGWANDIPDPNEYLVLIQGHQFANAAELLRDYSGWAAEDFTKFQTWMKTTFGDNAMLFLQNHHNHVADKHYWLNWDLAALTSVLSVGILCDDKNLTDYAISYYKGTAITTGTHTSAEEVGSYANAIPYIYNEDGTVGLGQCQESGRDQGHSLLDVSLLGAFCQMAKNLGAEGDDLFAIDNYRAVKMAEYVGKYNLSNDVEFTAYNPNAEYNHTTISAEGRGGVRPAWELFYRYANENNLAAKYTQQWVEKLRTENTWGEGGGGDYGTSSSGFDQLGYGTLMYADPTSADGQDTDDLSAYSTYNKAEKTAQGDTYVRTDNADAKSGSVKQIEIYNGTKSFYGLLSFTLPKSAIGHVKKAQLRLTTKRYKTGRNINVYAYNSFDEANANYTSESDNITTASGKAQIATFKPMGDSGKDVTSDDVTTTTQDGWTNKIDLTSYVQGLTTKEVNLLLTDAGTGEIDNAVQFFSKEWTDAVDKISVTDGSTLQPQLIIYHDGTSTGVFEVDGDKYETLADALDEVADGGTIIVTGDAVLEARNVGESETARISITKNVTIKGKTGSEVITRGSSDIAMKQNVMFNASNGKTVTFENFIFDDNNATVGQIFEVSNNHFILKDMTIQNSKSSATNGIVNMKNGSLILNAVTFKDSEIGTAFVRLGGGTLKEASIKLENSTGDHFRLGAIEIDDTKIADGTYRIEVEDAAAKIINVADESKYELTSIGYIKNYSDNTITFTEESDGQDSDAMEVPEGAQKVAVSCMGDTYVRKGNTADNGKKPSMEVYTYEDSSDDLDFVGLLGFKLPDDLLKEGAKLHKAQLRLVTKRLKGSRIIDMYAFYRDFEESTTYAKMESQINDMRSGDKLHRFHARGASNMDIVADSLKLSEEYLDISKWTNLIDLTELVGEAMYDDGKIRIALMSPINSKDPKMFFTKEADSIKNDRMDIKDIYLVPELTLIYTPGTGGSTISARNVEATPNADTFLRKGSNSDNSVSTCIEVYSYKSAKDDIDLVGLLSFALTEEAQGARRHAQANEQELFNATLKLVTKRVRGERDMNVYVFDKPFSGSSTYAEMESSIAEARENGKYATFKTAGQADKDITTDSGLTGDYKTSIDAWTNEIDLTELLKDSDSNTIRLMLSAPNNGRSSKQYFSSEAESFTNDNNKDFIVAAENLVPQLVITYRGQATGIEKVITIPVTESHDIYDLRGNRVKTMGKGVYIINGKKVLMK